MPAPKNPNTAAATAASVAIRARAAQERRAAELEAAGWTVLSPEAATALPAEVADIIGNLRTSRS